MRRAMTTPALVLQWLLLWRLAQSYSQSTINRHREGDMYAPMGMPCAQDSCTGGEDPGPCQCQCPPSAPVFRDDARTCVDDMHECPVAPFITGSVSQKIPFVFLPLKGQIINPSAEISFVGMATPICAVTSAQFLTKDGWADLQNTTYSEPPFRLFRDEGKTFLLWLGEEDLWVRMEGRLVLVRLMCRDGSQQHGQSLFTPCVAFRVAGTPSIRGVVFESPALAQSSGLTTSEYVAIAVCSVLLGLIYVASVFLFLYLRRRRKGRDSKTTSEDGTCEPVVKSNPLLGLRQHQRLLAANNDNTSYVHSDSASCCSDTDDLSDSAVTSDEGGHVLHKVTSAMVHTCSAPDLGPPLMQDSSSNERLPEENVSIVETESREEQPDTVKAISCGTARRKLYFNPAYFEPELLADPPPAAIEFLTKIREVISIAKHKMSAKRFSPSLVGIPEEEPPPTFSVSLKRENSRKKDCASCSTCTNDLPLAFTQPLPDFPACRACCQSESKHLSIRKWLEDVPDVKSQPTPPRVKKKAPPLPVDSHNKSPPIQRPKESPPKPPPTPVLPPTKKNDADGVVAPARTKLMDAVIKEMVSQRGLDVSKEQEYEADSLERISSMQKGISTPTDYGDSRLQPASNKNPTTTSENYSFNGFNNGNLLLQSSLVENDYEAIMPNGNTDATNKEIKLLSLPEILNNVGYSLVSEVYVNDGYNSRSSPSNSSNSSPSGPRIRYDEPGHLTICVEDSPDNYKQSPDDSDSFEPDTLDRKPIKIKPQAEEKVAAENYADSLERPAQILLSTTGSFRSDSLAQADGLPEIFTSPLHRKFGSLREIYETRSRRTNGMDDTSSVAGSTRSFRSDTENYVASWRRGRTIDPDDRQARRQRRPSPTLIYQNEIAPPLPPKTRCPYYEDPPPPRPAYQKQQTPPLPPKNPKPPLPPKNGSDRSIRHERMAPPSESSARRQLRSLPHLESYGGVSTHSSATSASPDSLSSGSGASVDSLNTSDGGGGDYEELCVMPQSDVVKPAGLNGQFILKALAGQSSNSIKNAESVREARPKVSKDLLRHMRDKRGIESVKKNWRRVVARVGTKPEDSGYLSTDSNESLRHRKNDSRPGDSRPGSVSETDESLCDGASESGAESIATDSFFFGGNFRKLSTCGVIAESVDSGVGSELIGLVGRSHEATVEDSSSDSENVSFVTVLPPGSGRRSALRC